MSKKLPLILVGTLFLIVVIAAVVLFKLSQKEPIRIPFFSPPPTQVLTAALEKASLRPQSPPIVFDDQIQASVAGYTVLFSTSKDLGQQVRALQLILPRLKMNARSPSVIDVRLINKVVIRY